ncbi:DUF1329 domain-containing protein [Solimonas fluminis]|nr:DUF1329 domain-containing protein [Solimonas fluminis]
MDHIKMNRTLSRFLAAGLIATALPMAHAKGTPEEIAALGGKLTCVGAERAGNADGSVAAWTGKWSDSYPGYNGPGKYSPGPYADEKPLFTITAQNAAQYEAKLTAGQKELLKRYPQSFRMPVYPSHRDFAYSAKVCEALRKNAASGEVVNDGMGVQAVSGAPAIPFPKSGIEAHWSMVTPHRAWTELVVSDSAVVYPNGNKSWGRVDYKILSLSNDPKQTRSSQDQIDSYFKVRTLLPERQNGELFIGWNPNDYHNDDRQTYFYSPGTRRVRQAPEFGFDTPQGAGGFRTVDDDRLFNGSPERYDWKLVGKKEIYVPYNAFRQNDTSVSYDTLLTPNTLNPDYQRYELHRVWVLEATVKSGYRHAYARRTFYIDEDSWHALWVDNYDGRGNLWRASMVNYFWAPEIGGFQAGVAVYHDLTAGAYFADRLVNQSKQWWLLNQGGLTPEMFSESAAKRSGH